MVKTEIFDHETGGFQSNIDHDAYIWFKGLFESYSSSVPRVGNDGLQQISAKT